MPWRGRYNPCIMMLRRHWAMLPAAVGLATVATETGNAAAARMAPTAFAGKSLAADIGSVETPPAPKCADYLLIDSRGSGEPSGLSGPGRTFVIEFRRRTPGRVTRVVRNPYPAAGGFVRIVGAALKLPGGYQESVLKGKRWLRARLARLSRESRCKSTKLLLVGYSQGAHVTGDVYQERSSWLRILGVALFGDPYFNSADTTAARGSFAFGLNGILGTRPPFLGAHVLSFCHRHDPVCQGIASFRLSHGFAPHENYHKLGEAQIAAAYFASASYPTRARSRPCHPARTRR